MIYSVEQKLIARPASSSSHWLELHAEASDAILDSPTSDPETTNPPMAHLDAHCKQLAACILKRIEARLPRRIRHLRVDATHDEVILAGQCSTYYTKQIAQHAAMGALEYERLINNIDVCIGR